MSTIVERRGDVIRIQASDDVIVAGVRVVVLDERGKALERGEALQGKEDWLCTGIDGPVLFLKHSVGQPRSFPDVRGRGAGSVFEVNP